MNIGQFDQLKEMLKDIAAMSYTVFQAYKNEGFNDVQALQLTLNFQTNMMSGGKNK